MRNEEVLHIVREGNILNRIKRRKGNWIGHILRRNRLIKHVIEGKREGKVEVIGRRGRRCKRLLDDIKRTISYWKLKEEVLDCNMKRTGFGRGYAPVVK